MKAQLAELSIATAAGRFVARYSAKGLAELNFPVRRASSRTAKQNDIPTQIRRWHRATTAALKSALAGGESKHFPPLNPAGTEFQQRVWNALRQIPAGQTKSYGEIARAIGKAKAIRAVGGACGANPIPVLIPCHRVLAANGKIGGFSGGLEWKRELLAREGIKPAP